jgi:hypothetical protein
MINAKNSTVKNRMPASCHPKSLMKNAMKKPKMMAKANIAIPKM